eukprot:scaffold13.g309.t1
MAENTQQLQRLGGVKQTGERAIALAGSYYESAKAYVPSPILEIENRLVTAATPRLAPLVTLATEKADTLLFLADAKVDASIKAAVASYQANSEYLAAAVKKQRTAQAANLETFNAARQEYLHKVEESLAYVKQQGLQGAARAASDALLLRVQEAKKVPAQLLGEIDKAWHQLLALPAVSALLEGSKKQVGTAFSAYSKAHDLVVASPTYSAVLSRGEAALKSAQATSVYQAAAARLYPWAAPYVEPALKSAQPYIAAVTSHLAPVAAA